MLVLPYAAASWQELPQTQSISRETTVFPASFQQSSQILPSGFRLTCPCCCCTCSSSISTPSTSIGVNFLSPSPVIPCKLLIARGRRAGDCCALATLWVWLWYSFSSSRLESSRSGAFGRWGWADEETEVEAVVVVLFFLPSTWPRSRSGSMISRTRRLSTFVSSGGESARGSCD